MPKKQEINLADFSGNSVEKRGRSRSDGSLTFMVWSVGGIVLAACGTEDHGANLFEPRTEPGISGADVAHTGPLTIRVMDGPVKGARIYVEGRTGGEAIAVTDENGVASISNEYSRDSLIAVVDGAVDVETGKVLSGTFRALPGDTGYYDGWVLMSPLTNLLAGDLQGNTPQGALDAIFGAGVITVGDVTNYLNYDLDSTQTTAKLVSRAALALSELQIAGGNLGTPGYGETQTTPPLTRLINLFETIREARDLNADDDPTNDVTTFHRKSDRSDEFGENRQGSLHLHTDARLAAHTKIKTDGIPLAAAPNDGNPVEVLVGGGDENDIVYSFASTIADTGGATDTNLAEQLFGFIDTYGNNSGTSAFVGIFIKPDAVGGDGHVGSLTLHYATTTAEGTTFAKLAGNQATTVPTVDADGVSITEEGFFYISLANLINLRVVSTLDASGNFGFEYYVWDGERRSGNVDKPESVVDEHQHSLLYDTSANSRLPFAFVDENIAPYIWSTDEAGENVIHARENTNPTNPIEASVTEDVVNEQDNVETDIYIHFADDNSHLSKLTTQITHGDTAPQGLAAGGSVTITGTYGTFTIMRDMDLGEIDVKYVLNNSSVAVQRLTAEDTRIEEITLSVFDGVHTTERTISVTVQGAADDDNQPATANQESSVFDGSLVANAAEIAEGRVVFDNDDDNAIIIQVGSDNTHITADMNHQIAGDNGFFTLSYDVTNKVLAWQYEAYNSRYFRINSEDTSMASTPTAEQLAAFNNPATYSSLGDTLSIRVADAVNDFSDVTSITARITAPVDDFTTPLMVTPTGGMAHASGHYNQVSEGGLLVENRTTLEAIGTLSGGEGANATHYEIATGADITAGLTALGITNADLIARVQAASTAFNVTGTNNNQLNFIGTNSGDFEAGDFHDILVKVIDLGADNAPGVTDNAETETDTATYQLYRLRLSNVNEAPEQIEGAEIRIALNETITLTEAMLAVRDPDRDDSLVDGRPLSTGITYTVSSASVGGNLMVTGNPNALAVNGTFTLANLRAGDVTFTATATDTVTFTLTATDTTNTPDLTSTAKTYDVVINAGPAIFDFSTATDSVVTPTFGVGDTLHAFRSTDDPDGNGDDNLSYQWLLGDTAMGDFDAIDGITASSYEITEADDGKFLRVVITYTDGEDFDEEVTITTAQIPLVNVGNAGFAFSSVAGSFSPPGLEIGNIVHVVQTSDDPDGNGDTEPTYQWVRATTRDGTYTAITDATASSYELTEDDDGRSIGVHITYTDGEGSSATVELDGVDMDSMPVALEIPADDAGDAVFELSSSADIANAVITDTLTVTRSTSDPDGDGSGTPSYQWLRDSAEIATATNSTYTLTEDDDGFVIGVRITYTDAEGTEEMVTLEGGDAVEVAQVDAGDAVFEFSSAAGSVVAPVLTVTSEIHVVRSTDDPDGNGDGAPEYQWFRGTDANALATTENEISGATGSSYTLGEEDDGFIIGVRVTYTDGEGTAESITLDGAAALVIPPQDSGDAVFEFSSSADSVVAPVLTADSVIHAVRTMDDPDGDGTPTYTWQSSAAETGPFTDIADAPTTSAYTIATTDATMWIRAEIAYTDGDGTDEMVTIAPVMIEAV